MREARKAPTRREGFTRNHDLRSDSRLKTYAGTRSVITGGLGLIGSAIARRLVALGADVLLFDSMIPEYGANLANVADIRDRVTINIADIRGGYALRHLLSGQDFLFKGETQPERRPKPKRRPTNALGFARSCYDHLAGELNEKHLPEVVDWIKRLAPRYRGLVVLTTKKIRWAITGEDPSPGAELLVFCEIHGAGIGHYDNLRGSNEFADCGALVILGREQPNVEDMEKLIIRQSGSTPPSR